MLAQLAARIRAGQGFVPEFIIQSAGAGQGGDDGDAAMGDAS